jgi:3-hydroxyisobutyrate dehydrogenase-like beta-hydroxyacid dehydrogenase
MATQVGFIGVGKMGRPMAQRLLAQGFGLHVFNRSRPAVDALAAEGAQPAISAREVAERAEIVLTALPTPASVEEIYAELAAVARSGQLFADHSTVGVEQSRRCGQRLRERSAAFLDAPVSGGPAGAQAGTLTVMAGGEHADFERARPVFSAFGKNIRLCGPLGTGTVIKLVNQLLVGIHTAAIAEAAVFGAALGADPKVLLEVIGTSFGGSAMMQRHLPRFISRDFSGASPLRLILKDLGLIHDQAKGAGAPLLLGAIAEQRFTEGLSRGMGEDDMSGLVRLYEAAAGVSVDKPKAIE